MTRNRIAFYEMLFEQVIDGLCVLYNMPYTYAYACLLLYERPVNTRHICLVSVACLVVHTVCLVKCDWMLDKQTF